VATLGEGRQWRQSDGRQWRLGHPAPKMFLHPHQQKLQFEVEI